MPPSRGDQNLLVGALALQLDFITRQQLIDAARQWMAEPQASLEDILRDQGVLSRDECQLLVALVDRHLARHNGDPQQSFAGCEASVQVRQVLTALSATGFGDSISLMPTATIADPHATAPLTQAGRVDAGGGEGELRNAQTLPFDAAATLSEGADHRIRGPQPLSQSAVSRFRVIKPLQRGGLGQVSLAQDEELNREVALKEILPRHADSDEARQRFLVEAEITGSLEHPGVVPVYGLGQYGDGRPFYAMRLIRGDNLQLAIEEFHKQADAPDRDLRFRQLLGRFVDVCNAIGYAHDRCVLHRDLKPGNIMLGKYGETLVVDWGLAKVVGSGTTSIETTETPVQPMSADGSTETQMGRVVGTPAYMSPEQASGRLDLIGPATDIYSLGATLYHLLVGVAPFGFGDHELVLGSVQMGRFQPPRVVLPSVPKPLEAVCLRAMARDPDHRYVSARALADDVERYLADEPVSAYREPFSARVWRWMRRHRALVLGSAAVLTVVAAALAIGVVLLKSANRREQHLRRLADNERTRAQSNFEMARDAVRNYYITVSEDTLLNQTGMQPLRDQLLRQALTYYQKFLENEGQDDALRSEILQANFFVGRITETVDSPAKAIPYYERAARIAAELRREFPTQPESLYEEGRALNALGGALQKLQRWEESQQYYRRAERVRQILVNDHPDNAEYVRTLANTIMNQGSIDAERGDAESAARQWQRAQSLRRAQLAVKADDAPLQADFGKGEFNLGLFALDHDQSPEAERHLAEAIAAFERVGQLAPDDLDCQYRLAVSYRILGDLNASPDTMAPARSHYDKAYEQLQMLSLRNPKVREYKADLGAMQMALAEMLLDAGQADVALAEIEKAFPPLEELVAEYPDVLQHARDLGVALRVRGQIRAKLDRYDEARADLARAVEQLTKITEADPADDDFKAQLEDAKSAQTALPPP